MKIRVRAGVNSLKDWSPTLFPVAPPPHPPTLLCSLCLLFFHCSDLCSTSWQDSLSVNPHLPPRSSSSTRPSLSSHLPSGARFLSSPLLSLPRPPVRQGFSACWVACCCRLSSPLSGYLATPTVFARRTCGGEKKERKKKKLHSDWRAPVVWHASLAGVWRALCLECVCLCVCCEGSSGCL